MISSSAHPLNSEPASILTGTDEPAAPDQDQYPAIRQKLLLREAQLSQAQRMAGMASWEWYFGETAIRWSPEMYLFWGYEPGEIEVDLASVAQATHLDDLPILQSAIARVTQGENVEMQYRRFDKLGREIFIHTIGRIIHNEAGDPIGVFGIDMNVTRHKQQEQHLADLNRELAEKNRELEQRNNELNTFAFAASHDLQEPLRKIQTFNSLILDQEATALSELGQDYFRRSMGAANRMQTLIKDLIAYSRTNLAARHYQLVDLNNLLAQVRDTLGETIVQKQARIEADPLPTASVVAFMFYQLFQNLIGNALTYSRPDMPPVIRLTYRLLDHQTETVAGPQHQLTIADNGIGFEPVHSQQIFELFKRLHNRSHYAGTGLGLSICQRVLEHHGGTITADGQPGQGATFVMRWPVQTI
jgi:PAS domain S-box-containing protein